ncbi:tyrosine-type recombinase/integrase [Nocardiopsis sp. FIRDI 009]|uniref:tyrosine-type recombinase/integrase n=1 Tax=Nocardiopsis sp. FIRDI 009 TaxID=714197 RepID=UPI000E24CF96|nr:tyrosine-type recombinase/integrase [Nocardiopsis sp. FIRDI 009]
MTSTDALPTPPRPDHDDTTAVVLGDPEPALPFVLAAAPLPAAVAQWLSGLKSEHTRAAYRRDLTTFHTWLDTARGHTDLAAVEVGDIEAYARHLREERGEKRKTVARRLSTLSALYRRLMVTGHATANPADPALVSRGETRVADTPTRWVQGTDLQPVLAAADERDETGALTNPRTAVLIRLLTLYGLRVSETTWLTFGDLVDGAHGTQLRVRGKGDVVDHVDLDQDTCDALAAWLIERTVLLRQAGLEPEDPALPLIVSPQGKGITRQAAADVVTRLTQRVLGRRLTPHSLRKSTAVAFHQAGYSDRDLKRWGRWRTLNTVSTYVDVADDDGHPGLVAAQVIASARPQARRAPAGRLRRENS